MVVERLNGLDAAFLAFDTPAAQLHVAAALVFEGPGPEGEDGAPPGLHPAGFATMVRRRIHLVPAFRRRIVRVPFGLHHPLWVEDPAFDLDYHLRRASLPAPGGHDELAAYIADVAGRPLDADRPLWELHLVEGLEGGHVAVVAKIHHAVLDGAGGIEALAAFLDPDPQGSPRPDPGAWAPEPLPGPHDLVAGALTSLAREPTRVAAAVTGTFGALRSILEQNRRLREEEEVEPPPRPFTAPATSINGAISAHRRYGLVEIPLEDVRAVTRTFGGTVNDVLLAAAAGAVRRLLAARGERPAQPLVAMVPVSTRSLGSPAAGNRVTAMLTSLATDVADPVERLHRIAEGTRRAKGQARLLPQRVVADWAGLALPALSGRAARLASNLRLFDHVRPPCNLVVSNIRGPHLPLWCAGSRLVGLYPVGPVAEGVGLNVTAASYLDRLHVGVLGCRELVPEAAVVARHLGEAVAELVKAAERGWGQPI